MDLKVQLMTQKLEEYLIITHFLLLKKGSILRNYRYFHVIGFRNSSRIRIDLTTGDLAVLEDYKTDINEGIPLGLIIIY